MMRKKECLYRGKISSVGSNAEDAVQFIFVEFNPVDPVFGHVDIDSEDIMAHSGNGYHSLGRVFQRVAAR